MRRLSRSRCPAARPAARPGSTSPCGTIGPARRWTIIPIRGPPTLASAATNFSGGPGAAGPRGPRGRPVRPAVGALARPGALPRLEFNLPNLITLARLLCVPLAIWLILEARYGVAFWVFVAAGISDALDGYIAKRFDQRTPLGALLDPIADKALLAGVYITLGLADQLPHWLVILVVLRDLLIVGGYLLIQGTAAPQPPFISKVNALVQIALIGFV